MLRKMLGSDHIVVGGALGGWMCSFSAAVTVLGARPFYQRRLIFIDYALGTMPLKIDPPPTVSRHGLGAR